MMLAYSEKITFDIVFALVASAIIVFVPIYTFTRLKYRNDIFNAFFLSNICLCKILAYLCEVVKKTATG